MMIDSCWKPAPPPKTWWGRLKFKFFRFRAWIRRKLLRWRKVKLPMVKRQLPPLNAYDICNVQPMTGKTGLIYTMSQKYKKDV